MSNRGPLCDRPGYWVFVLCVFLICGSVCAAAALGLPDSLNETAFAGVDISGSPPLGIPFLSPQSPISPGHVGLLATSPTRVTTPAAPTPVPTTPSRILPLLTTIKRTLGRVVTIPVYQLVILIALVLCGIITLVYLIVRWRTAKPRSPGKKSTTLPQAAILDVKANVNKVPKGQPNPVYFPSSLEKKYISPEFVGEGGLARVFRAQRQSDGATVAVKVPIRFDEATGTHFTRDILSWQGLHHKNIIEIYRSNILPIPYIEMEYARSSLAAMQFPVSEERALAIIQGVAEGLAYAHEHGIAHRDIKPENILISDDGIPKISDWGLSKLIADPKKSHVLAYSPGYAAPEQIAPHLFGRPGPWTDIYQIGILLYEMLIGTTPFERNSVLDMNHAILYDIPHFPRWGGFHEKVIKKIILKCLEKNPKDRYDSVTSLLKDLEALKSDSDK